MLVDIKEILRKAQEGGYAVGAFNTINLETTRAILEAAHEERSPIIIQMTEKTMEYTGGRAIFHLIRNIADFYFPEVPYAIHLDHGKSFEIVERAVEIGFGSAMYDGSRRSYPDNLAMTKKVSEWCHAKGVAVQAEIGSVPYLGEVTMDMAVDWDKYMTDPDQAKEFVDETKVDAFAVAIGNAHGFFRERTEPDYERLEKIRELVHVPLVLHGASDWEAERVKKVIERGISCFNVDTATRVAFISQLKQTLRESEETDLRKVLSPSRDAARNVVQEKLRSFGCVGKTANFHHAA